MFSRCIIFSTLTTKAQGKSERTWNQSPDLKKYTAPGTHPILPPPFKNSCTVYTNVKDGYARKDGCHLWQVPMNCALKVIRIRLQFFITIKNRNLLHTQFYTDKLHVYISTVNNISCSLNIIGINACIYHSEISGMYCLLEIKLWGRKN